MTVHVNVSEKETKARDDFATTINNYLGTLGRGSGRGASVAASLNYETVLSEYAAVGTPAQVTERIGKFRDMYQPDGIICWFNTGGMISHQDVETSMNLFAEEVMPHFG